jgi:hypothetical protein
MNMNMNMNMNMSNQESGCKIFVGGLTWNTTKGKFNKKKLIKTKSLNEFNLK